MELYDEPTPTPKAPEKSPHIIEYPGLVKTVQLSVARLLDIRGSLEANSFSEVLSHHPEAEHERMKREVGAGFDEALINLVTASLIGRGKQEVVILADATAGVDGYLPWEAPLQSRLEALHARGIFQDTTVRVERYTTDDETIATLTENAQALAAETTLEYHHA